LKPFPPHKLNYRVQHQMGIQGVSSLVCSTILSHTQL
jgi:hypothetical protein